MLEYFSYQKLKKHQAEKAAREAENAATSSSTTTPPPHTEHPHEVPSSPPSTSTNTAPSHPEMETSTQHENMSHAQEHHIPRKPLPVLTKEDEDFLRGFVGDDDEDDRLENRPVLPVRPVSTMTAERGAGESGNVVEGMREAGDASGNEGQVVVHDGEGKHASGKKETYTEYAAGVVGGIRERFGKGKERVHEHEVKHEVKKEEEEGAKKEMGKEKEKHHENAGRFGFIGRTFSKKDKTTDTPPVAVTPEEAAAEKDDITAVLDNLNLSAVNNRAFSVSAESQAVLQKFTVVLKDLIAGGPHAYDDLTHLLDNSQDTLEKGYENLPGFLKKLVAQLPTKLTGSLAPELLAVASEAQGLSAAQASGAAGAGFGAAAKNFLTPSSLKDLVTKPGAVVSLLKSIMNVLKLRWPAFMGTNVLFSLGLFILLFVFWYCHKRGKEERLKRESAAQLVDSEGRIIELDDDAMLEPSSSSSAPSSHPQNQTQSQPLSSNPTSSTDRARSSSRTGRVHEDTLRPRDATATTATASGTGSRSRPTSASSWRSRRSLRRRKDGEKEEVVTSPVVKN